MDIFTTGFTNWSITDEINVFITRLTNYNIIGKTHVFMRSSINLRKKEL